MRLQRIRVAIGIAVLALLVGTTGSAKAATTLECQRLEEKELSLPGAAASLLDGALGTILKSAAKAGGWLLDRYANKFDATYSAKTVLDGLRSQGKLNNYGCTFKRTDDDADALLFEFQIRGSKDGRALRVTPTNLVFKKHKAQTAKVPFTKGDDLELALAIIIRSPELTKDGKATAFVAEPSPMSVKPKKFSDANISKDLKPAGSDWVPAPRGDAFSVQVKALESSDMKEWLEKVAKALGELGE